MSVARQRAVLYARVSTEEQGRGYSIPTQLEAMRRYCEQRSYLVIAEYTDTHSGTEIDRPGMSALIDALPELTPDVVVLYDVDRLGREVIVQAILERELTAHGARVEYVLGGDTGTPEGELLKMMKAAFAVYDNRQRVEKARRGKRGRVQAGYPIVPGSRAPFGYTYISEPHKGYLAVNEAEAQIVRQMYHWLTVERLSCYEIAKRLWEQGILTRGDQLPQIVIKKSGRAEWSPSTVRRILSNPLYKGEWYWGKTRRTTRNGKTVQARVPSEHWVKVDVPAIVDATTWEEAQRCLQENKQRAKRNTRREYLLRGMIVCVCGRRFTGRYKTNRGRAYYRCPTSEKEYWRKACPVRFSYPQEAIEKAVWDYVIGELLHPDRLLAVAERQQQEQQAEQRRREQRLRAAEAELADIDRKLGHVLSMELDGYPAAVIGVQKRELLARRGEIVTLVERLRVEAEEAVVTADTVELVRELARTVEEALPYMTFADKRKLLEILRVRVDVVDREHVRVSGLVTCSVVNLASKQSAHKIPFATILAVGIAAD